MIAVPRSEQPRASIVISAARDAGKLRECLASLERHGCDGVPSETVVVLNGSGNEVEAVAREELRGAQVVESPINVGFAAGVNLGRSAASGEYVVVLHDDTVVGAGWLSALVETADGHPEAGVIASLALWPDGRVRSAGVAGWRGGDWRILGEGEDPHAHVRRGLRAVYSCSGCSVLVPAATFDAIGGLDEELFPAGWVDQTLTASVRRLGQVILLEPRSRVVHEQSFPSRAAAGYRHFAFERNRGRFVERFSTELERLPPRPADDTELPGAIEAMREQLDAEWRQRAREWNGSVPAAPRVRGPFGLDAERAERIEAALPFLERERETREAWCAEMLDQVRRADADNVALRASRDEAVEYARSLEVERERRRAP